MRYPLIIIKAINTAKLQKLVLSKGNNRTMPKPGYFIVQEGVFNDPSSTCKVDSFTKFYFKPLRELIILICEFMAFSLKALLKFT